MKIKGLSDMSFEKWNKIYKNEIQKVLQIYKNSNLISLNLKNR